ncbi:hypothetical protein L7F22_048520 [Adiantum nelumboides]|nr:hypothetical protein [Adiantum nelumboides]
MNHFRRSISEIVQVVKIADVTLRARLEEFKNTPSGQLTVEDFRSVWLEEEQNPPAYYLNSRERGGEKNNAKGKSKDDNGEDEDNLDDLISDEDQDEDEENDADEEHEEPMRESSSDFEEEVEKEKDPRHIQAEQIAEDEATNEVRRFLDDPELQDFATEMNGMDRAARRGKEKKSKKSRKRNHLQKKVGKREANLILLLLLLKRNRFEQDENQNVSNEQEGDDLNANRDPNKNQGLDTIQKQPVSQLEENDGRNRGEDENDPFLGLDETELDRFILSPEEVAIKERVWVEFNKDYLEMALTKQLQLEQDLKNGITRKPTTRRKREKPRDSSTAAGSSAAEAAKSMMEKKKWSKRINYGAVQGLFDTASSSSKPSSSKRKNAFEDSDEDDDEDDIIEEEGGLPSNHPSIRKDSAQRHRIREREKEQRRSRSNSRNAGGATSQSEGDDNVGKQLTDTETEAHTDGDLNDEFGQQEDYDETVGDDYWD